jgi:dTDP-4-dehydrorhamnose reductase
MKILVLGASGMIGSAMFRVLGGYDEFNVWGTIRKENVLKMFTQREARKILYAEELININNLSKLLNSLKPDVVINCAGLTKHRIGSNDPQISLPINALFPHKLADLSSLIGAKVIHISTDCVFSGDDGPYTEDAKLDGTDMYGIAKALGELNRVNTVTLRTSTVGHEFMTEYGLLEWFLAQNNSCKGYANALFSGLTNIEFARVVAEFVIPNKDMSGIYHVGGNEINKFDLLTIFSNVYRKEIKIIRDESLTINRSLNSHKFKMKTGYTECGWYDMVSSMRQHKILNQY